LAYYQDLMAGARRAIGERRLESYIEETRRDWAEGEAQGG
jgi:queuine tRNA-ribosyltransferase